MGFELESPSEEEEEFIQMVAMKLNTSTIAIPLRSGRKLFAFPFKNHDF